MECDQRLLMFNYDGSSCFMNSLLVALFFPTKLHVFDTYLLQGIRTNNPVYKELREVLQIVAKCVRGQVRGSHKVYMSFRPLLSNYLEQLTGIDFSHGQHDPTDLFEALLRACNIGGVFLTQKKIYSEYSNGQSTQTVSTDEMFRYSVYHSVSSGMTKFETLFPAAEQLVLTPSVTSPVSTTAELVRQKTVIEFLGGPVVVLTREVLVPHQPPVHYGRYSASDHAYYLPLINTVNKQIHWYELQSVLCWQGHLSLLGTMGHYICFVYDDKQRTWWYYNDLTGKSSFTSSSLPTAAAAAAAAAAPLSLTEISNPEDHPSYQPSLHGVMFFYKLLSKQPHAVPSHQ